MTNAHLKIESKQGGLLIFIKISCILGSLIGVLTPMLLLLDKGIQVGETIVSLVMGLFVGVLGVLVLTVKVVIDEKKLRTSNYWYKQEVKWSDISKIIVMPLYGWIPFFGFNIAIYSYSKPRGITIHSLVFRNSHILTKAIIELAHKANPEVFIEDVLLHSYGQPPYGIVEAEKAKQVALKK